MNKPVNCGCGGEPVVEKHQLYEEQIEDMFIVRCTKCDIQTSPEYKKEKAIETWNKAMGVRTAMVIKGSDGMTTVAACEDCCTVVNIFDKYCPGCGARLEWK